MTTTRIVPEPFGCTRMDTDVSTRHEAKMKVAAITATMRDKREDVTR